MFKFVQQEVERLLQDQIAHIQKVAILGLQGSGKTTIVKNVLYQFQSLFAIAPGDTPSATNFEFLGHELIVRDLGGESRYVRNFFTDPPAHVSQIRYVYYIIDIQDTELIRQNVVYFLKLITFCEEYCPFAKIYLFLHKCDDFNQETSKYSSNEMLFLKQILPALQAYQSQLTLLHTTAKNPFTIRAAFLQPLLSNEDIYDTLCSTIQQFCHENQLDFGILLIEEFEVGHYYTDLTAIKSMYATLFSIFEQIKSKKSHPSMKKESWINSLFKNKGIITEQFQISVDDAEFTFYFSVTIPSSEDGNQSQIKKKMQEFTLDLKKILRHAELIRDGKLRVDSIRKI